MKKEEGGGSRDIERESAEVQRDLLFVEVDTVVVLTTCVTATTVVLAVLADTAVSVGHVATQLAALLGRLRHLRGTGCKSNEG